ncbi:MAG: hypothetical protein HQ475_08595 [SAR202 cluster bacterium]|nr:hypothetical protein [SAR202 cluster bacterium]
MMYFKECPKCHGDLYAGEDVHGQYVSCIQCGYMRDVVAETVQKPFKETFVIEAPKRAKKTRRKVRQAA